LIGLKTHKKIPSLKLGFFFALLYNNYGDIMNGILLVNKPKDYSSHDVVAVLRGILKTRKIGHTGTLDPDATGLLVVGIGKGTKIMKYLNQDDKEYIATCAVGVSTTTEDATGEVVQQKEVNELIDLESVLSSFKGSYVQTPPMYSAIKYKGKRLYEYARKGIVIDDLPKREIHIHNIELLSDITYQDGVAYFTYKVHASKGLYVRTLSYDIAKKLGYPGHNSVLNRTKAGNFDLKDSYTLEEIQTGNYKLLSLSEALSTLPSIVADEIIKENVKYGRILPLSIFKDHIPTRIIDKENNLLAIYDKHPKRPAMKAMNVFMKD
jgi:tRNA pseudouridine55 synthase